MTEPGESGYYIFNNRPVRTPLTLLRVRYLIPGLLAQSTGRLGHIHAGRDFLNLTSAMLLLAPAPS